jgi:threo-3-hydroxy-L-aspartate ammonia-lyase
VSPVTFDNVQQAAVRIKGKANRTPVFSSRTLNQRVGADVFLKCENFQRIGAFKFRGAYNAISQLSDEEKARGVITYSSGNHAQGTALAGQLLGVKTVIVMPNDAPKTKRAATEAYGADVIEYDPNEADRKTLAHQFAAEKGYFILPPFDHAHVIAGQGTSALELFEDYGDFDYLLTPCGGGGLLSGSAIAAKCMSKTCKVVGIEPEVADDATRSFHSKTLHTVHNPPTIADGTRTSSLGDLTFPLVLQHVDDMRTVTEAAILDAVRFLFYRMKLVVEPSGALGVAALLSGALKVEGRVGVVISGGNVDADTMTMILQERD